MICSKISINEAEKIAPKEAALKKTTDKTAELVEQLSQFHKVG